MVIHPPSIFLPAPSIRLDCRCAECRSESSGAVILDASSVPEGVAPVQQRGVGNYALGVVWSDGHESLYTFRQLRAVAEGREFGRAATFDPRK